MGGMSGKYKIRVVSGPSGSGKSSLIKKLRNDYDQYLSFCVSHTTREPRVGEVDGKDYHFVSKDNFLLMIQNNKFIEYTEFSGNYYGTSKKALDLARKKNRICIFDVDLNGVKSIKKTRFRPIYIFIKPPNKQELEKRLTSRKSEDVLSLKKRLESAEQAIAYADQKGVYHYTVLNDDIDQAYQNFKQLFIEDIEKIEKRVKKRTAVT